MKLLGMLANRRLALGVAALCSLGACESPRQVSESGFGAYEVSLAAWGDGLALAWYDTRHGNAEVYVRHFDALGRDAGPELRVTTTPAHSYEADIAPLPDSFAIAWYEKADDALSAQLGLWRRDGTQRWTTPVAVGAGDTRNAIVRTLGDALFCAWIEAGADGNEAVWGGWWELDGRVRAAPVLLGAASANTWNLNAAVAESGAAIVVFDAQAGTRVEELFVATLADGRASLVQLSVDDGVPSKYPDIALAGADAALTWFDERDGNKEVYLAVAPLRELVSPIESRARRVTETPGASIGAYVAWNRQRIGLAWSDDSDGNYEVYYQSFDAGNYPQGPPRRLTETVTDSLVPAIKPWRDAFAVAWDEVAPGAEGGHDPATRAEVLFTTVR